MGVAASKRAQSASGGAVLTATASSLARTNYLAFNRAIAAAKLNFLVNDFLCAGCGIAPTRKRTHGPRRCERGLKKSSAAVSLGGCATGMAIRKIRTAAETAAVILVAMRWLANMLQTRPIAERRKFVRTSSQQSSPDWSLKARRRGDGEGRSKHHVVAISP